MSNVAYSFSEDGTVAYGKLSDGTVFIFDADKIENIKTVNFYCGGKSKEGKRYYIIDSRGRTLHDYLFGHREGYEIDHINLNTMDNRSCNIRYCTHQQNQMNQSLQKNNTSGVSGVSYYPPRKKYRARIKISQNDIHLGYYSTFEEAVMARNVGMLCLFGEYGRYNRTDKIPLWIIEQVVSKCIRFAEFSVCQAFFNAVFEEGLNAG